MAFSRLSELGLQCPWDHTEREIKRHVVHEASQQSLDKYWQKGLRWQSAPT